jgi:hypothetical protein
VSRGGAARRVRAPADVHSEVKRMAERRGNCAVDIVFPVGFEMTGGLRVDDGAQFVGHVRHG